MNEKELWQGIFETRAINYKTIQNILSRLKNDQKIPYESSKNRLFKIGHSLLLSDEQINDLWLDILKNAEDIQILKTLGIKFVRVKNAKYPKKIINFKGKDTSYLLYYKGDLDILKRKSIAIVGSRKASDFNLERTYKIAKAFSDAGYNIISGFANGVDLAAHSGALAGRGKTTIVLSNGILKFREEKLTSKIRNTKDIKHKILLISEFPLNMPWYAHNAMKRNSTIASLSDKVFIIESEKKGGTFAMGKLCLKQKKPLYVMDSFEKKEIPEGNLYFLSNGGKPLSNYLKYLIDRKKIERREILNEMKITSYL